MNARTETFRGQEYVVRRVTGSAATKPYRCPGCHQVIRPATPHTDVLLDGDRHGRAPALAQRLLVRPRHPAVSQPAVSCATCSVTDRPRTESLSRVSGSDAA